jgi:hypothetical protein
MGCSAPNVPKIVCYVGLALSLVAGCGRIGVGFLATDGGQPPPPPAIDSGPTPDGGGDQLRCPTACENAHGAADCSGGRCVVTCENGYADCDSDPGNGCEISTMDDRASCGSCQTACENPNGETGCSEGLCTPSCAANFADCDALGGNGCETDLTTPTNCGGCGARCENAHGSVRCVAGSCSPTCDADWGDCDGLAANGCETNLARNPLHCGTCTRACAAGSQTCESGSCQTSTCPMGSGECDSDLGTVCETDLASSSGDCGFCGNACTIANGSAACAAMSCIVASCNGGYDDCDGSPTNGCETPLTSSSANCGSCGDACSNAHGTTSCAASSCVPVCSSGWGNCDAEPRNGCEAPLNTVGNCGMCGRVCPANGGTPQCLAGVCSTACDLTGSFALKFTFNSNWSGNMYLVSGSGTFTVWAKLQLVQSGTDLSAMVAPCGQNVPAQDSIAILNQTYSLSYPNTIFDRTPPLPATASSGSLGGTTPGSSFMLSRSAVLFGVTMTDPLNGSWPGASSIQTLDSDEDGKRGLTTPYRNGGGYDYPPVNQFGTSHASSAYLASRIRFALNGSFSSCTQASGGGTVTDVDVRIVGCRISGGSRDCNSGEADHIDSAAPNFQTNTLSYTMVKIADSATCSAVRAAVP